MATYEEDVNHTLDPAETLPWFPTSGSPHQVSPRNVATSEAYTLWGYSELASSSLHPLARSPGPPISPDPTPLQLLSREPPIATAPKGSQPSPPFNSFEQSDTALTLGSLPLSLSGSSHPKFNPLWVPRSSSPPIFLPDPPPFPLLAEDPPWKSLRRHYPILTRTGLIFSSRTPASSQTQARVFYLNPSLEVHLGALLALTSHHQI